MAQISKPPIPLTMYKHFAVATVTLTACIAMFADSDNREAMAEEVEEQQQRQEWQGSSDESDSQPELVRRDIETPGSFGSEEGGSAGSGGGGGGGGGVARRPSVGSRAATGSGRISVPGYEQSFIDGLSEAEYRAFLEVLPPEMRRSQDRDMTPDLAEQRRAVEAASARRAGQSGAGSDGPG